MLGDVGRGAAVFPAKGKTLAQPQRHQEDRGKPADRGVGRQQTDQEGRGAHHHDGDQEGVFPSDQIADAAEHQRAERPDQESRGVGRKRRQQRRRIVAGRKEQRGEEWRQNGIEIEVVPFEDGAERRSEDDEFLFAGHAGATCGRVRQCGGHGCLPSELDPSLFPKQNDASTGSAENAIPRRPSCLCVTGLRPKVLGALQLKVSAGRARARGSNKRSGRRQLMLLRNSERQPLRNKRIRRGAFVQ